MLQNAEGTRFLVEVKSIEKSEDLAWRLSGRQIRRLRRSAQAYMEANDYELELWFLGIGPQGQLYFMPLEGS